MRSSVAPVCVARTCTGRLFRRVLLVALALSAAQHAAPATLRAADPPSQAKTEAELPAGLPKIDAGAAKGSRVRTYADGVRINWDAPAVEVDAVVVLQQGQLELLACSPQTREHESILVIPARPRHVFEAMGLIGLEPGTPLAYDETADSWSPPRGHALTLEVRYEEGGKTRTAPVEEWLYDIAKDRPVEAVDWVFAGSMVTKEGQFLADQEGTIVCVVDFPTALIAIGALHTSDDSALWLAANTKRIPPQGTRCTLLIRARDGSDLPLAVSPQGALVFGGEVVSTSAAVAILKRRETAKHRPAIVLHAEKGAEPARLGQAAKELAAAGVDPGRIRLAATEPKPAPEAAPRPDGGEPAKRGRD